ncbi:unnamed protein product [Nippostrongylus brasiliensis]|uniref:MIF4G domain-containing protein n=1 Tax=Nippostrongylus brasiliensis TaxID=27835 RepID=A0A0N4YH71_NIPBR|nr:unnamed protein product [Nippostrongylus brasiliensis]
MLKTSALQVKHEVAKLKDAVETRETDEQGELYSDSNHTRTNHETQLLQKAPHSTGQHYAEFWRPPSQSPAPTEPALENAGMWVSSQLATYLRSMACVDPGIFKGLRNENFGEFVRRFKRKYKEVVGCEATLIEILADDHLAGRAKNIFMALPRTAKERGFEAVVDEMGRLLAQDSTAARVRALTDLKKLRMRSSQDVAEFCVALEKLVQTVQLRTDRWNTHKYYLTT